MKKIFKEIISIVILNIDTIFMLPKLQKKEFYELCCVKVDALGDFILWLGISNQICNSFRDKKKILICNKLVYEFAIKLNQYEMVIPIDIKNFKNNLLYRSYIFSKLNSLNIKLSIHSTYSRDALTGDSIMRAINSKHKIGFEGDLKNQSKFTKLLSNNWYSKLIKLNGKNLHEIQINLFFLKSLNLKNTKMSNEFYSNYLKNLKKLDFKFNSDYIVICPGASDHSRAWDKNKFTLLNRKILNMNKYKIVLCGSKQDTYLSQEIVKNSHNKDIIDLCGKTSIEELMQIIKFSKFVIGNDSASIHIAYLLDIPSICITGGNNFGRFIPYPFLDNSKNRPKVIFSDKCYQNNWSCSRIHECINQVSENDVFESLKYLEKY